MFHQKTWFDPNSIPFKDLLTKVRWIRSLLRWIRSLTWLGMRECWWYGPWWGDHMDLPDNYHLIEDFVILYIFIYKKWVNLQRENNLASFVKEKDKFGLLKIKVEFQNIALLANEWDIKTYYKKGKKNKLWRYHNQIDFVTRNETKKYSKATKGLETKSKILEKNRNKMCPKCKEKTSMDHFLNSNRTIHHNKVKILHNDVLIHHNKLLIHHNKQYTVTMFAITQNSPFICE